MIGIKYTLKNKENESIVINDHTTNPNQIIALQSYPQFEVDIKNNELPREGQHGIWDFYSFYGRRITTFQGVIVGNTELDVEIVKNKLIKILAIPAQPTISRDGNVELSWTDIENKNWIISGKLMNPIQFNRRMRDTFRLDFSFTLKSSSPFIVSNDLQIISGVRGYVKKGAQFPIMLPLEIGFIEVNYLNVTNSGSAYAETIIRIYGESQGNITNPKLTNLTTGKFMQLNTVIEGKTEWIEIDSKKGTVVDKNGNDLSGAITGESNFVLLQQGLNNILYTSDEDPAVTFQFPTASFSVKFRDTKL